MQILKTLWITAALAVSPLAFWQASSDLRWVIKLTWWEIEACLTDKAFTEKHGGPDICEVSTDNGMSWVSLAVLIALWWLGATWGTLLLRSRKNEPSQTAWDLRKPEVIHESIKVSTPTKPATESKPIIAEKPPKSTNPTNSTEKDDTTSTQIQIITMLNGLKIKLDNRFEGKEGYFSIRFTIENEWFQITITGSDRVSIVKYFPKFASLSSDRTWGANRTEDSTIAEIEAALREVIGNTPQKEVVPKADINTMRTSITDMLKRISPKIEPTISQFGSSYISFMIERRTFKIKIADSTLELSLVQDMPKPATLRIDGTWSEGKQSVNVSIDTIESALRSIMDTPSSPQNQDIGLMGLWNRQGGVMPETVWSQDAIKPEWAPTEPNDELRWLYTWQVLGSDKKPFVPPVASRQFKPSQRSKIAARWQAKRWSR